MRAKSLPESADVIATEFRRRRSLRVHRADARGALSGRRTVTLEIRSISTAGLAARSTLPPVASVDEMEAVEGDLVYSVETYLAPRAFHRRTPDGRDVPTNLRVTSPVHFDDMEVTRVTATSQDGTDIPINIIRRKGIALDGSNPTLLYGYGGYGISLTPYFLGATRRLCFDARRRLRDRQPARRRRVRRGVARDGQRSRKKQNVFDDFAAARADG